MNALCDGDDNERAVETYFFNDLPEDLFEEAAHLLTIDCPEPEINDYREPFRLSEALRKTLARRLTEVRP